MRNNIKIHPHLCIPKLSEVYKEPITICVNKFDENALSEFHDDLEEAINTGQPVIPIVVDSYGGHSYGVIGMINLMENCPIPIATILISKAMSAGAILFSFGTEGYRFMHKDSWIMIHDVGAGLDGKIEDIKSDTKQMDDLNQQIYKRMSLHLGHKQDYISNLIKQHNHVDLYLTGKEAKKHNIANHLRIPNYNIEIGVNVTFG